MKFEDWTIGQTYDVMTSGGPYPLGRLVQKYQVENTVALDFVKVESGEEYLYLVDATETYVIHTEPGEAQDRSNRELRPMSVDQA